MIIYYIEFKSLFLPREAEFIYIEGDNKIISFAEIINFIYNETTVSRALPSLSVDYNWFAGINLWMCGFHVPGQIMTHRLYLSHFFGCRCRYWGFICAAIIKVRLSEFNFPIYIFESIEILKSYKNSPEKFLNRKIELSESRILKIAQQIKP